LLDIAGRRAERQGGRGKGDGLHLIGPGMGVHGRAENLAAAALVDPHMRVVSFDIFLPLLKFAV
jgi:hypothetical protein